MGELRHAPTQAFVDLCLARGVGEVIHASDDVRDAHVMIINDDGQIVGGGAIRAQQDEVIKFLVLENDATLDVVVDDGFTFVRRLVAYGEGGIVRRLGRRAIAPG